MSRYDLTDFGWSGIEPMLPQKSRGVPRVDDRRVLNGIFGVLRSGAPWADLPGRYGPPTTWSNRKAPIAFDPKLYQQRNLVERFFKKL